MNDGIEINRQFLRSSLMNVKSYCPDTVEPRLNQPLHSKAQAITNDLPRPSN